LSDISVIENCSIKLHFESEKQGFKDIKLEQDMLAKKSYMVGLPNRGNNVLKLYINIFWPIRPQLHDNKVINAKSQKMVDTNYAVRKFMLFSSQQ